jgi:hypothetical protein
VIREIGEGDAVTLRDIHGAGLLVWIPVAANLFLALWAFASGLAGRRTLSEIYWAAVFAVLALLAVQVLAGMLLFAGGSRPRTLLHVLYGISVAIVAVAQYGLRPGGWVRARILAGGSVRETTAMALLCLTQAGLVMRAWMTAFAGR